jgi:hypothetical protein
MSQDHNSWAWTHDNSLTIDVAKLLQHCQLPDTPDNRELALRAVMSVTRETMPDIIPLVIADLYHLPPGGL